jgi:hypothetical protein
VVCGGGLAGEVLVFGGVMNGFQAAFCV